MTDAPTRKPLREGQAHKRDAILAAAGDLFVSDGVERTSMDAVARLAGVSKRTVYDYYGDKRRLLLGIIEAAGASALSTLRTLIETHLGDGAGISDADDLQEALTRFAEALGASMLVSPDYRAAVTLIAQNEALLPELEGHPLDDAHAHALSERIAHFAGAGMLDAPEPAVAAEHLVALTALRVLNEPPSRRADAARIRRIMRDGAQAFLRAYRR